MNPSKRWPGYFERGGRPLLLVGSGEHYGAVLNGAFDFDRYLDTLAADGLNHCRVFSGTYRERPGDFGIQGNVLAPDEPAFLCPWPRRPDGWFDLFRWNDDYWLRLRTFCRRAAARGIVVEYVLFCHWYTAAMWEDSPMHPARNVQGIGPLDRTRVYRDQGLLRHLMGQLARKAADELAGFDHVVFEVCNEPYTDAGDAWSEEFEAFIVSAIREADPSRTIAVNVANGSGTIDNVPGSVDVLNFHYAQPDAVERNRASGCVVADDETGFAGVDPAPYRREAWRFLLAGGGVFSNLDYGFTVDHPGGDAEVPAGTPGSGGPALRRQLGWLRRFLEDAAIWDLRAVPAGGSIGDVSVAADSDRAVGWIPGAGSAVVLDREPGTWRIDWYDPVAGVHLGQESRTHAGGNLGLQPPGHTEEAVFRVERRRGDGNS